MRILVIALVLWLWQGRDFLLSQGYYLRRIKISQLIPVPSWMKDETIRQKFKEVWISRNLQGEDIELGLKYELLEEYQQDYDEIKSIIGEGRDEREYITALLNLFIGESRYLKLFKDILARTGLAQEEVAEIADIGSGTGGYFLPLRKFFRNARISGLDSDPGKVIRGNQEIKRRGIEDAKIYLGDILQLELLPEFDREFNLLFMFHQSVFLPEGDSLFYDFVQMSNLFESFLERLKEEGAYAVTTRKILIERYPFRREVFEYNGFEVFDLPATPFEPEVSSQGIDSLHLYLRDAISEEMLEDKDVVFIGDKDALANLVEFYQRLVTIAKRYDYSVARRVFKLRWAEGEPEEEAIGIKALSREELFPYVLKILQSNQEKYGLEDEEAWFHIELEIKDLLDNL